QLGARSLAYAHTHVAFGSEVIESGVYGRFVEQQGNIETDTVSEVEVSRHHPLVLSVETELSGFHYRGVFQVTACHVGVAILIRKLVRLVLQEVIQRVVVPRAFRSLDK